MAGEDIITMTQEELKRLHLIRKALDKSITQIEAANIIGLCLRQVQRIIKRVKTEGDKGITNKSWGQLSNRALPNKIKDIDFVDTIRNPYKFRSYRTNRHLYRQGG